MGYQQDGFERSKTGSRETHQETIFTFQVKYKKRLKNDCITEIMKRRQITNLFTKIFIRELGTPLDVLEQAHIEKKEAKTVLGFQGQMTE